MTTNVKTAKIILGENLYQLKYYSERTMGNISQGRVKYCMWVWSQDKYMALGFASCYISILTISHRA